MSDSERVSGAANSTTVDWSRWMQLDADEQKALWAQYRAIITAEAMRNRATWRRW